MRSRNNQNMTTKNNPFYELQNLDSDNKPRKRTPKRKLKQDVKVQCEHCNCPMHKVFRCHHFEEIQKDDVTYTVRFPFTYRQHEQKQGKFYFEKLPKDIQLMIFGYIARFYTTSIIETIDALQHVSPRWYYIFGNINYQAIWFRHILEKRDATAVAFSRSMMFDCCNVPNRSTVELLSFQYETSEDQVHKEECGRFWGASSCSCPKPFAYDFRDIFRIYYDTPKWKNFEPKEREFFQSISNEMFLEQILGEDRFSESFVINFTKRFAHYRTLFDLEEISLTETPLTDQYILETHRNVWAFWYDDKYFRRRDDYSDDDHPLAMYDDYDDDDDSDYDY